MISIVKASSLEASIEVTKQQSIDEASNQSQPRNRNCWDMQPRQMYKKTKNGEFNMPTNRIKKLEELGLIDFDWRASTPKCRQVTMSLKSSITLLKYGRGHGHPIHRRYLPKRWPTIDATGDLIMTLPGPSHMFPH
jgi:hypothetical protein